MSNVVPLRPAPLFRRVVVMARGRKAHIFLAGPVWGGKPRPLRWVGSHSTDDRIAIRRLAREAAECFALDLVEDKSGCIDPKAGPSLYRLNSSAA